MRVYKIWNVVNVDMYNSILDPAFTLDDEELSENDWIKFDNKLYSKFVCERAVIELKELLCQLPEELKCEYIEGSAFIDSPEFYNYRTDEFCFKIRCESDMTDKEMQEYFTEFFLDDWNAEFGSAYEIYEYISGNYGVGDFYYEEF